MGQPKIPPHLPGLIDAHCHLDYPPMSPDLQACFDAGTAAGVVQYVHIGCAPESIDRAVALADAHAQVFAAVGIHPHEAKHTDAALLQRLRQHAANPKVVAIGETGLDYHYDLSPRDDQRRSLAEHVELARSLDMPLVLHVREDPRASTARLFGFTRPPEGFRCATDVRSAELPAANAARAC